MDVCVTLTRVKISAYEQRSSIGRRHTMTRNSRTATDMIVAIVKHKRNTLTDRNVSSSPQAHSEERLCLSEPDN